MCTDFICWVGVAFLLRWGPKSCRSIFLYICSSTSSSPPSIPVLVQIFPLCLWSAIIFSWQAAALRPPSVTWQKVFPICCFLQFSLEGKPTAFCRISVLLWGGSAFHRPSAGCGMNPAECWMLDWHEHAVLLPRPLLQCPVGQGAAQQAHGSEGQYCRTFVSQPLPFSCPWDSVSPDFMESTYLFKGRQVPVFGPVFCQGGLGFFLVWGTYYQLDNHFSQI